MLKKTGIVRKTFLFAALLIFLVTLVSFIILYFAMPSFYLHQKEQSLQQGLVSLEKDLQASASQEACMVLIANFIERYNVTVTAVDSQGEPILALSSPLVSLNTLRENGSIIYNGEQGEDELFAAIISAVYQNLPQEEKQQQESELGDIFQEEDSMFLMYEYDTGNVMLMESEIGTEMISRLQVQGSLQPIDEAREVILMLIPYVLAAGCTIGLVPAWLYARQITRPILKISAAAVRMKHMEPGVRASIKTGDELEILSDNMDALYQSLGNTIENLKIEMEKVNRLEKSRTEMMQSASHELKTPIAALSGMLDGMLDNVGVYKDREAYLLKCKEQVEKLAMLVKEILAASKADHRQQEDPLATVFIDEMIRQVLHEYELLIIEKQLKLKMETEQAEYQTEAAALYRVMMNLIGNAVMYTPPAGTIHIKLAQERLMIENQCSHIPEEEMQKLFEPFYTRSSSRDKSVTD